MSTQFSKPNKAKNTSWMVTFADLLALLLTFFVLLFSMSNVKIENWQQMVSVMSDQFNPARIIINITPEQSEEPVSKAPSSGRNLNYLLVLMGDIVSRHTGYEGVEVFKKQDRVVISVPVEHFFRDSETSLYRDSERFLRDIAGTLTQIDNRIKVVAHTNENSSLDTNYRYAWEVSITRARIVAGTLTAYGYKQPVTVMSYADTHSVNVDRDNITGSERVEIIIMSEQGDAGRYDLF